MLMSVAVLGSKVFSMLACLAFLGEARKHSKENDLCNVLTDLGFAICLLLVGLSLHA